uniref:MARVEL domain-containing protein n=1 Tax=Clastoptera arizonana TaxID=38151 RepID=A0A1B6E300_9HEMI
MFLYIISENMPGARIPELNKCICGCSLRLGAKIIAATFFTLSAFIFISSFGAIFVQFFEESKKNDNTGMYEHAALMEFLLLSILSGLLASLSTLLWYGIEKHSPSYVLPWCILTTAYNGIFLLFILITLFIRFITLFQVICLQIIAITFYAVLIVYSYFRELTREKNSPAQFNNAE